MEKELFIGLKTEGIDHLSIEGGEGTDDYHITLVWGKFESTEDDAALQVIIDGVIQTIKEEIPDTVKLDATGRFLASVSSDWYDVIYARVARGQLEDLRNKIMGKLKKNGIDIQGTFKEYNPHITLAYIDPAAEWSLEKLNETAEITQVLYSFSPNEIGEKSDFEIKKADNDKRLVFGWANIATRANGEVIQDWQDDIVDPEDLEEAVYEYVLNFRDSGEEHQPDMRKKGRMVESVVFTDEKLEAMGIPKGTVPLGWWIGFYIDDDDAWEKVKNGTYTMFSVEGTGQRVPAEDLETRMKKSFSKSFSELAKFNPYHGPDGRFTSPGGAVSFTFSPGKSKAHDNAIARERERQATQHVSAASGKTYSLPKLETKEAEQDRATALEHLERHFSLHPNRNKEKIDAQMHRYLDSTDPKEWNERAHKTPFSILRSFTDAKTRAEKEQEAAARKDRISISNAKERAASKRTQAHQKYVDYEAKLKEKYPAKDMFDRFSWYERATPAERNKLRELDDARIFRNKRGQWQIAKTFSDIFSQIFRR